MNKRDYILILVCAVGVLLIYSVDLFKLDYRLSGWKDFGKTSVRVAHIQYFIADTPNLIGYTEQDTHEIVSCAETVAYVESDAGDSYRCCDTGQKISCYKGDFSSDIPASDEACLTSLRELFGVPASLPNVKEYTGFGECAGGRFANLTMVQLDDDGTILWKSVAVDRIQVLNSALRCVLGPLLLLLALWIIYKLYQQKHAEPIPKLWKSDDKS